MAVSIALILVGFLAGMNFVIGLIRRKEGQRHWWLSMFGAVMLPLVGLLILGTL